MIVDEHPLRGFGALVHNVGLDALLHIRHRGMLNRLAKVAENIPHDADAGRGER